MQTPANVTWIKVDRPSFDLWGVLVSSLSLTGLLALLAVLLGAVLGIMLIRRRRRQPTAHGQQLSLQGR